MLFRSLLVNKSLNFIVELEGIDAFGRDSGLAIIPALRLLPRVIRLPEEVGGAGHDGAVLHAPDGSRGQAVLARRGHARGDRGRHLHHIGGANEVEHVVVPCAANLFRQPDHTR